jgi:hydroxyacylglutathione hydrolase
VQPSAPVFHIHAIAILEDNYVWLICRERQAWIIDPGASHPIIDYCSAHGFIPRGIFLTHAHADHWLGAAELKQHFGLPLYGPAQMPPAIASLIDTEVREGDSIDLDGSALDVWSLPGHTAEHIGYWLKDGDNGHLFSGDTLFSAGCGRVNHRAEALFSSISRIAALPPETWIYPSHEYTLANLRFAKAVEPNNPAVDRRRAEAQQQLENGLPSLPVRLCEERQYNPFLRCHEDSVKKSAQMASNSTASCDSDVFLALRAWKNVF